MASLLSLKVQRQNPVLVPPSSPTPYELKLLSDIDEQEGLRFQIKVIQFYRSNPLIRGRDPALVIKEALGKALVHYYPFAGRLREAAGRELVVECTGEGILFIEADADARLEDFGESPQPPFPHLGELLFNVEGSGGVVNSPLLLIQVTRLLCGGFILAIRHNHTMSDAAGLVQFMTAVAELARGAPHPTVKPVWKRELLSARNPPRVTCFHREHEQVSPGNDTPAFVDLVENSFFFGPKEIKNIRDQHLPAYLRNRPTFEILTACLWKCRTAALRPDYPEEEVRIICTVNARSKFNPPIPLGYYGNMIAFSASSTTAAKLCRNPLGYALEKVMKAKSVVTDHMRSLADLLMLRSKPYFTVTSSYIVSDVTRAGFEMIDLGWGPAVYGGPATTNAGIPGLASFYMPSKNADGENGMVVLISLPAASMDKFVTEIEKYIKEPAEESNKISQFTSFAMSKI